MPGSRVFRQALHLSRTIENLKIGEIKNIPMISGQRGKKALMLGDVDEGTMTCGQGVGLIKNELTVKEVIEGMVKGAETLLNKLNALSRPH
jgi:NAD(P)H-dependent flavin oxidoreductase YrpB (nitropropane dioxygenase family)